MGNFKKTLVTLIIIIGIGFIFSNLDEVKAENSTEYKIIEYSEEIDDKKLEDIKENKFKILLTPQIKVEANPIQEDTSKYYYNQLKHDVSKNTYSALENDISNKVKVNLSDYTFDVESATDEAVIKCFRANLLPYVMDGYEAYIMDGAKNYWWTSDVEIGNVEAVVSNGKAVFKHVEIISNMKEWTDYNNFNSKLKEISQSISGNTTYEIVRSINYYICSNVDYKILDDTEVEQTAYGPLMENAGVCEGQAQLFNLLCREKGVTCINVYGYTNENNTTVAHAWNYVYEPSKGKWYAVDVTWNNQFEDVLYLMVGNNTIINEQKFSKNHMAGFKQYKVQTFIPTTPVLADDRYIKPITIDQSYIKNIQPNTKYSDFIKEFGSNFQFKVEVKEGDKVISGDDIIKTGQIFSIGSVSFTLVVNGDVNKDGKADIKDILAVNKHRLNKMQLTNECEKAGDTNDDQNIDIKDILQINKFRLKKINEF